ncbi:glycosyltransferase family 4 protein [Flavobacterium sp. GT2N3]|uniref:glycosyltransferase family 4 protein n=1 Tax=unclassified Flavobacterium TaxID=196869 RepID=UPI003AB0E2AF
MTNQKNIAILCNYELLPERIGGMDYFFWMFDEKCKENGIQVDWFFPNQSSHGNYSRLTIHASNYENVEKHFYSYCLDNNRKYSVVVTHFIELCTPIFKKIKEVTNAKIIAVDHNPRPTEGYPLKKKFEKRIKGILFSRYIDLFVGVSKYSKSELIKEFGTQIRKKSIVVFNGLEISKFKNKKFFNSTNQFIVASHLRKDKGIQDLILAVNDLKSFDFTIDIYGQGYFEGELKKMIQDFGLQIFFNFKGSVSNLNEIYCHYDYLIHPSHGETFCYTVVESMLSNLPVITTRNQGNVLGLIVENINGFLFEEKNIVELKGILENILSGKSQILENPTNIKLQSFTLEKMVNNYLELIL